MDTQTTERIVDTQTTETIGKLTVTRRQQTGKEQAQKLRAKGLIPAVCYGHGGEAISLTVDPNALRKALDPRKKQNTVIELSIEDNGKTESCQVMLKDYQIDTIRRNVLHADFVRVADDQVIQVPVPLTLEGKPEGVKNGGTLHQVFRALPVKCRPRQIPTNITADVSALNLNEGIRVKDLAMLPEGVMVHLPPNQTIALVMAPRKVVEEAAPVEGAEGAAGAEGAEGGEKKAEGKEAKEE